MTPKYKGAGSRRAHCSQIRGIFGIVENEIRREESQKSKFSHQFDGDDDTATDTD